MDDFAMVVHLAQPAFGVGLVGGHDAYVVDPLTGSRSDIEAVSDHRWSFRPDQPVLSGRSLRALLRRIRLLASGVRMIARKSHANLIPSDVPVQRPGPGTPRASRDHA